MPEGNESQFDQALGFSSKVECPEIQVSLNVADYRFNILPPPFHPLLHAKRLSGKLAGLLSFRITRDWRVIFQFNDPETIQLLRVKHRKDVYR
ncbi:MAG: type II toxin-antitoxin system RelE/ParE family toxin [Parcubacteria group bacterium]|nr:type II toxin-antitoxin system RelE/ParE family toxin [Parcubacteria group bacterium]